MKEKVTKYFFTGLVFLIPLWITIYITWLFLKLISNITKPLIITFFYAFNLPVNEFLLFLFSFILSILTLYFIGFLANTVLGKKLLKALEGYLLKLPIIKDIYLSSKKLINFFTEKREAKPNKVVIIEYPRKGITTIGFVTVETENKYGVFVPSTPNPTTGYLVFISKEETKVIDLSVEEAMKIIVSGGISMDLIDKEKLSKML